jgi:hypothetical protein
LRLAPGGERPRQSALTLRRDLDDPRARIVARTSLDQRLFLDQRKIPGQRRAIGAKGFGEITNRLRPFQLENGEQRKLSGANAMRSQILFKRPRDPTRCPPRSQAEAIGTLQELAVVDAHTLCVYARI